MIRYTKLKSEVRRDLSYCEKCMMSPVLYSRNVKYESGHTEDQYYVSCDCRTGASAGNADDALKNWKGMEKNANKK